MGRRERREVICVGWDIGVVVQHTSPGIKQTWVQISALSLISCGFGEYISDSTSVKWLGHLYLSHRVVLRIGAINVSTA